MLKETHHALLHYKEMVVVRLRGIQGSGKGMRGKTQDGVLFHSHAGVSGGVLDDANGARA